MHILFLPDEILSIIVSQLDLKSKLCAYNTCRRFRATLTSHDSARRVCFPYPWDIPQSIELSYFSGLAPWIQEVVLSRVKLDVSVAIPALMQLVNLRSLDVTYTKLPLLELSQVCINSPSLTDLAADFILPRFNVAENTRVCHAAFKRLESVHFTGIVSRDLSENKGYVYPHHMLVSCERLHRLRLSDVRIRGPSLCDDFHNHTLHNKNSSIKVYSLHANGCCSFLHMVLEMVPGVDVNLWDVAVIANDWTLTPRVYLSARLYKEAAALPSNGIEYAPLSSHPNWWSRECSTMRYYLWHGTLLNLNPNMCMEIVQEIFKSLPNKVCTLSQANIAPDVDSYFLSPCTWQSVPVESTRRQRGNSRKRIKVTRRVVDLNIERFVRTDKKIKVTYAAWNCECHMPIRCDTILSHNIPALTNIVFFSTIDLNLGTDFYDALFRNCHNLETFLVHAERHSSNYTNVLSKIHLSASIKNVRIVADAILNMMALLKALSGCRSLHTFVLCNTELPYWVTWKEPIINERIITKFINGCPNLRTLAISLSRQRQFAHGKVLKAYYTNLCVAIECVIKSLKRKHINFEQSFKNELYSGLLYDEHKCRTLFEHYVLNDMEVNKRFVFE